MSAIIRSTISILLAALALLTARLTNAPSDSDKPLKGIITKITFALVPSGTHGVYTFSFETSKGKIIQGFCEDNCFLLYKHLNQKIVISFGQGTWQNEKDGTVFYELRTITKITTKN